MAVSGESYSLRKKWLAWMQDSTEAEIRVEGERERLPHEVYGCYYDMSGLEEQGDGVHGNAEHQQHYWILV